MSTSAELPGPAPVCFDMPAEYKKIKVAHGASFIESLAGKKPLGISKNQLDGVTKEIAAYRVQSVSVYKAKAPIYLVDTPGFADRKISEMKIIKMIEKWMKDQITDTRVAGSKKRVLEMFKVLTGKRSERAVLIVTTMWDELWTAAQIARGEARFKQLRDEHWKDFITEGSQIAKFENNLHSALRIIDQSIARSSYDRFGFENMIIKRQNIRETQFGRHIYNNLRDRVTGLRRQQEALDEDLNHEKQQANQEVADLLEVQLVEVKTDLKVFEQELLEFGPPPSPSNGEAPSTHLSLREASVGHSSIGIEMQTGSNQSRDTIPASVPVVEPVLRPVIQPPLPLPQISPRPPPPELAGRARLAQPIKRHIRQSLETVKGLRVRFLMSKVPHRGR
ncbi:hypothetical protein CVT24_013190 [Panaeolus cyanescens]|uniref:G domain-containing protein n=1 Tax=Panaeolus cyanescens TaxID=181874 RepID=A0A409WAH1_9AGAR|nr:hypothetical protein CVT24_013190 [Panaeolus cyanescens]